MMNKTPKNLVPRQPVVVVMGHIDHGKSTLLDYIRKTNIVAGEAGGITQHVGAYEVEHTGADGKKRLITFLDTPGHAAFSGIRRRGAQAADIAILVVSAEDGVKPQTVEVYKNIKDQNIPYIVAITKIDKTNADINKTKQSLGENEIYVEGWGGDIPCVAISAVTGDGVSELLEMVTLVSDLSDPKTDPSLDASGVVVESSLDARKGVSATLLVREGTLKIGTYIVAGDAYVSVRFIEDFKGTKIESATAGKPARIIGWSHVPQSGTAWVTVDTKKTAEKMTEEYIADSKRLKSQNLQSSMDANKKATGNETGLPNENPTPEIVVLPLIIKADVIGSLEGVKSELSKIQHDKVVIQIVAEGIGEINENDIKMTESDPSIILIGFNADPDKKAKAMIERSSINLNIKTFSVIYELSAFVESALLAKVPKEYIEEMTGRAKILAIFGKDKDRQVIGGKVETGIMESGNDVRIMRRDIEIGRGKIRELQEKKVKTREVAEGHEFGMLVDVKIEVAPGDRVEAVHTVEKKQ
ncbi:MAG: translation initiation factor IF-2 [Candidatus Paceibacterota bacterium]|jgi:translation initiation factor IF-2